MKASPWSGYYHPQPGGRFRIATPALRTIGAEHPDRVLDTQLWGKPAKVLLLDKPLQLGDRISDSRADEYLLRRIRLHDLPGWPPKMASAADVQSLPALMDCKLRDATFSAGDGPGQEAIELVLEHQGKTYRAWLTGCPVTLLRCVEATLSQEGALGRKMADVQDIRLIGPEF